ncbi:MAG TPA: thioesterase family protein [Stellaceae bacterium]|nr:thioesterase family protein [Stellaceae bacterium]
MVNPTEFPDSAAYPFWVGERIRNADTDQFQHVNNAAIASYCEAGRMELFAEPTLREAIAGLNVVVVKLTILFERELFYPGAVRVGTCVTAIGNTSFQVSQGLYGTQGRFATSEATCVMMERAQHKPIRVPDAVRALFTPHARIKQP